MMGLVLPSWLFLALLSGTFDGVWPAVAAAAALAALSFLDDLRGLPPAPRLAGHVAAVALGLVLLPGDALLFDGALPLWADRLAVGLAWVWFVNLFNFMDGIDGITGVETIAVAGGLAAAVLLAAESGGDDEARAPLAAVLAGAAAGFLALNWRPAKLFAGDVGSVPLGYLLGWLLVWTACVRGWWQIALLLPLYYWADATTTLLWRAARGEKVWRPHRDHAYQAAVRGGAGHDRVSLRVAALNVLLVALSLLSVTGALSPRTALVLGAVPTAMLLWFFRLGAGGPGGSTR